MGFGRGFQHNNGNAGGPGPMAPVMGMNAWSADGGDVNNFEGGGALPRPPPGPGQEGGPPAMISPKQVLCWLDHQDQTVLRRVMYHCKWVLEQRGLPVDSIGFTDLLEGTENQATPIPPDGDRPEFDDMSGWYEGAIKEEGCGEDGGMRKGALHGVHDGRVGKGPFGPPGWGRGGGPGWRGRGGRGIPSLGGGPGWGGRGGFNQPSGPMQWTPAGWVPKDNSHKVTTTMKQMPTPDVIPNVRDSEKYPEADADRNKLRMLENNKRMMDIEVFKICKRYNVKNFNKDKLEECTASLEADAKTKLTMAISCVTAAEKTLNDFRDFLKEDKYKEFNDEQNKRHEESLKSMIGEMPQGVPHKKPEAEEEGGGEEAQE